MEWAVNFKGLQIPGGADAAYFHYSRGGTIEVARNEIVADFLKTEAEWLFFLDSDVVVPPDAIKRLLSYDLPIVSGVYYVREPQSGVLHPAMWRRKPGSETDFIPVVEFGFSTLVEVDAVGAGCLLINRLVLEKMKPPWFKYTRDHTGEGMGEDFLFCTQAKKLGYKVMADPTVMCDHLNMTKVVFPGNIVFQKV